MGFIQTPAIRIVYREAGKATNIVSASYDFSADAAVGIRSIPGKNFEGTSFLIDLGALGKPRSLPAVRSMQFTAEFVSTTGQPFFDGPLFFYNPDTGELLEFGPSQWIQDSAGVGSAANAVITAVVGLVCPAPTKLLVAKCIGGGTAPLGSGLFGNVYLSLYDFDRQPYIAQGFYNGFLAT